MLCGSERLRSQQQGSVLSLLSISCWSSNVGRSYEYLGDVWWTLMGNEVKVVKKSKIIKFIANLPIVTYGPRV